MTLQIEIVRKPYRRSISVAVAVNGCVRVTAPRSATHEQIRVFLDAHRNWILKSLKQYQSVREKHPPKQYREGELFPYLGMQVPLHIQAARVAKPHVLLSQDGILVSVPTAAQTEWQGDRLAPFVVRAYQAESRRLLHEKLLHYSSQMQLYPRDVRFGAPRTRWGSCSSRGSISLNWKLLVMPKRAINYVVVHELAHLQEPNHSAAFWRLVATQIADYREWRRYLNTNQFEADFLARRSLLHP